MKVINGEKFVTLEELAEHLNQSLPEAQHYRVSELAQAWADARAKHYTQTGRQVEKGVFYDQEPGETEQLLSRAGCALIDSVASVDGHTVPVMRDGAETLFK